MDEMHEHDLASFVTAVRPASSEVSLCPGPGGPHRAGQGTSHPGEGACRLHGGAVPSEVHRLRAIAIASGLVWEGIELHDWVWLLGVIERLDNVRGDDGSDQR